MAVRRNGFVVKNKHRRVIVLSSLVTVLTLTSALLLALAPAPLTPDGASSLFAIDAPQTMDAIFQTDVPVTTSRWKYIYVHHSRTISGSATTLATSADGANDHFVIGNGDGCVDGEIQLGQRWNKQIAASPPVGAKEIDPDCISICLVGDFDHAAPTPAQLSRLTQLVSAIQTRLHIRGKNVIQLEQSGAATGVGRYFPRGAFREQILP